MSNRITLIFLICILVFVSCNKDDDNSDKNVLNQVQANVKSGTW